MKAKIIFLIGFILFLWGCNEPLVPVVPVIEPAHVVELILNPNLKTKINLGEETQISWSTNGNVTVNGQRIESNLLVVKPEITTIYKIISSNGYATKIESVTIEVVQPDPEIVRRSAMFARAPWTLYEDLAFSEGKWCTYDISTRNKNAYHLKPGVGFFILTAEMDTIHREKICFITIDSLIVANEKLHYELTDSTLSLFGFSNVDVIQKFKRK